ncbi:hypothetical protein HK405_007663, partial [Cladochytrium tenue]
SQSGIWLSSGTRKRRQLWSGAAGMPRRRSRFRRSSCSFTRASRMSRRSAGTDSYPVFLPPPRSLASVFSKQLTH